MAKKKVAPKKRAPRKSTPVKKTEVKTPANGDLRKPQVKILQFLSKSGETANRARISKMAKVDQAGCTEWIGSKNPEVREENDRKHFPSLISLGLVKETSEEDSRSIVYSATAKGKRVAAKA